MSHLEYWSLAFLMIFDFFVAAAFAYMLICGYAEDGYLRKTGVVILMAGILYQACQSAVIVFSHQLVSYTHYPFWVLKDIGAAVWASGLIVRKWRMNHAGKP